MRRHGGTALSAPALREVTLGEDAETRRFAERLAGGEIDVVVFLTGVGTRWLAERIRPHLSTRFASALSHVVTVARGPKPRAALRALGVEPTIAVPEPNTSAEVLVALDRHAPVSGRRVAIQEYGEENPELVDALRARGADVLRVPIYRWALPEDLRPLQEAIAALLEGAIDVALFTSATQVEHLFRTAADPPELAAALSRTVVGSIGPVCTRALTRRGVRVDVEPEHPKMGHLVRAAADVAPSILSVKRRATR